MFLFVLFQALLLVDMRIYAIVRFHITGLVLNVLPTEGAGDSVIIGKDTMLSFAAAVTVVLLAELALHLSVGMYAKRLSPARFVALQRVSKAVLAVGVTLIVAEKGVYAYADIMNKTEITKTAKRYPLYQPFTVKGFARRVLGVEINREDAFRVRKGGDAISYPKERLTFDAARDRRYNIVIIILEGARADMLNEEVRPNMSRFGREHTTFMNHYSGGNAAIGMQTEFDRIGKALQSVETDETFLQKKFARMIRAVAAVGLSLCALAVLLYGLTRGNWINGSLVGIALVMALLPEEIPFVLTVFLALGAWRMAQKNVLTRRMPAIETLGAATLLCVDKTGTLTMNRMTVSRLCAGGEFHDLDAVGQNRLPQSFHALVRFAALASETDPFDPMEKAFKELADRCLDHSARFADWTLAHEYSLAPELLAMSHVWRSAADGKYLIATKGAPEAVADLCHFNSDRLRELARQVDAMAADGLRVLGVAKAEFPSDAWPASQHDFDFTFLGLIGLADPLRPEVPAAICEPIAPVRSMVAARAEDTVSTNQRANPTGAIKRIVEFLCSQTSGSDLA